MFNLEKILEKLAKKQPVFHSEADFQHALAWEIHICCPSATVRLEIHPGRIGKREYIDIWVKNKNKIYAIELKYKTKKIDINWKGESFYLLNQSAQDCGRYDFIKDIERLERFVIKSKNQNTKGGYAVLLTNVDSYWKAPRNNTTVDAKFRLHEGRKLSGIMEWGDGASSGTKKGREKALKLKNAYHPLHWRNYSNLSKHNPNQFRYLLIEIKN